MNKRNSMLAALALFLTASISAAPCLADVLNVPTWAAIPSGGTVIAIAIVQESGIQHVCWAVGTLQ